ncbi:hypothetical protein FUSO7_00940 [Fusobacterium necrophorum BFTR-2]|nr:hypothetical protein [Fusobacterium necrophorum]KDE74776.1 hypothetical protein FUSO7_00940 [Fusobacterium necrophorum BFTR-2]MDY2573582.1 hypothetical protein [Fusobacterium necrophorum]
MYGLDRACVSIGVSMQMFDLSAYITKYYPQAISNAISRKTTTFDINHQNINKIKIEEKRTHRVLRIDFSYPRKRYENNVLLEDSEESRKKTEEDIVEIVRKITGEKVKTEQLAYDFLEFTTQEKIKSFYYYHNIVVFFYRALSRNFYDLDKTQYYNYAKMDDKFYTTGFIFKPVKGWKIRLYGKNFEHNKYHEKKVRGGIIRLEHLLTRGVIKKLFKSHYARDITIEEMRRQISEKLCKQLFHLMLHEIERASKKLEKALKGFKSRDLENILRDYSEWILDESIADDIVTKLNQKSYRQLQYYRVKIRNTLRNSQERASPKRDFFNNIERLEIFFNEILLQKCEVKCNNLKHFTCFLT